MRRIDQYEAAKTKVDEMQIDALSGYQVEKLLYASIWGMYGLSFAQRCKRVLALLVCDPMHLTEFPDSADGLDMALEILFPGSVPRSDNAAIFNNLYDYIKPARHVLLEKRYRFRLRGAIKRTARLLRYARFLRGFSLSERLYLAAQLVLAKGLAEKLDRTGLFRGCRYLLIFQEYDTISSLVIQNAHLHGVKVISPQHGMPMNRHENNDQLFFDGFLCDYKLVWNDFERDQYLSAGIDPRRIFVVGNTKTLGEGACPAGPERKDDPFAGKTACFGVLLNYPKNDGAPQANRGLLAAAKALSGATGMRYLVKPHPTDSLEHYADLMDPDRAEAAPAGMTMAEYQDNVLFSLAHVTGAIFDLIYAGQYVFQYIAGERFPVDLDDIYRFTSPEELIEHFNRWKADYARYRTAFQKTVDKYYVPDARQRHDRFFQRLFAGELGDD